MNSPAPARIALLGPLVIDQIAAGEVVDRPASVVKELVDNSLDAGSSRIDVELEDGGVTRIVVRDNGRGIHPDDLVLAVTRHATSKLRNATDIADIATLGFRGEALASVAAVARVDLRSRQPGAAVGVHLHAIPGEVPTLTPAGMPVGTQVEVHALFANLPARRKFMRAEATEVGHVSDTLLRLAIVHPGVHFTLRHGKRELLNLPRATREGRVAQVLERRVAGPFFAFRGEDEGVRVEAYLPHPTAAARGRGSPYIITRQRVVRERSLAQILAQAYGLGGEAPSACIFVEPPASAVDVNVHPQKAEVRFSDPQQVYAAVRRVLALAVAAAPWAGEVAAARTSGQVGSDLSAPPGDAVARPADLAHAVALPPGARPGGPPIGFAPVVAEAPAGEVRRPGAGPEAPGPATRHVEKSAAAAAVGRRAAADAWLARAEASVDAGGRPVPEPAVVVAGPAGRRTDRAPLPGPARADAEESEGAEAPEWDLDLAPAGGEDGDLAEDDDDSLEGHVDSDMSSEPGPKSAAGLQGASPGALDRHVSPDMSRGTFETPAGSDMSPGTAVDEPAPADPWLLRAGADEADPNGVSASDRERALAWAERAGAEPAGDLVDPLLRWSERRPAPPAPPPPPEPAAAERPAGAYRLSTRALDGDYDRHKRALMHAAAALRPAGPPAREPAEPAIAPEPLLPDLGDRSDDAPVSRAMREQSGPNGQAQRADLPALLACLPGPVALFAERDAVLAVDLRRVRSHLVYIRLQRDLVGRRAVAVQGLLSPAVVRRPGPEVTLLLSARAELLALGVDIDAFGDDAVVVRGVPAHLRYCVDDADAADLVARIVPWLRIRAGDGDRAARERGLLDAIATTRGGDPAPRLARRWLGELIDAGATLESVPGIRRWTAGALLGGA